MSSELKLQYWSKGPLVTESRRVRAPALGARDRTAVSRIFVSWNQMAVWLRHIDGLRTAA